jgi:hypothetical protein
MVKETDQPPDALAPALDSALGVPLDVIGEQPGID